jgi:hypothetical protein
MTRYVLMFYGPGSKPAEDVATIKAVPGLRIIDATSPNVVVVESRPTVKRTVKKLANWMASEETVLPGPRPVPF